eukprot:1413172-Amphidinium_carterae.1
MEREVDMEAYVPGNPLLRSWTAAHALKCNVGYERVPLETLFHAILQAGMPLPTARINMRTSGWPTQWSTEPGGFHQ